MRLWTLHPQYLDPQGLVALWRESLLARAVLHGQTSGYKQHPQLDRFRSHPEPCSAIGAYLAAVYDESVLRGYSFDKSKIGATGPVDPIEVTAGQVKFEWLHLMSKLTSRSPALYESWSRTADPVAHPLFRVVPGEVEPWERIKRK